MDKLPLISEITPWEELSSSPFQAIRAHVGLAMWPRLHQELSDQLCTVCFSSMLEHYAIIDRRYHRALFDCYHGCGSWDEFAPKCESSHKEAAFAEGFARGQEILAASEPGIISYEGFFLEEFKQGLEEALAQHNSGKVN